MKDAGELARSLLDEGYAAMKIWPFDGYATRTQGNSIALADLKAGLEPFRKIREAVGERIEVMCELHSLYAGGGPHLPGARGLRRLLGGRPDLQDGRFCRPRRPARTHTRTPICGSETLAGAATFRAMLSPPARSTTRCSTSAGAAA